SNDGRSFADIVRLKRLEDVLEKYWNSHRMDHTVNYLIEREFASAFDFFQEFGDYWEGQGWQKIGHQLEDLFTRLQSFLESRGTKRMDMVLGLMKLDYFLNHKYKPRKIWWEHALEKDDWSSYMKMALQHPDALLSPVVADFVADATQTAAPASHATDGHSVSDSPQPQPYREVIPSFASLKLGEKELQKHAVLDVLPFRLDHILSGGSPLTAEGRTLLLVVYQQNEQQKPLYYTMPIGKEIAAI
ncbi:DUF4080 domain-containing protein, partial [Paenibacillus sp. 28ISP30-2]|nr:DUF4080 domain-containing protein [Paenibacillus sp. 28ISP30-2]